MQLSVQATRKEKLGIALETTLAVNGPKAESGLRTFYFPVAKPDVTVDFATPFVLQHDKMRWCRERMVEADLKHQFEIGVQTALFARRKTLVLSVGGKLVNLRRTCGGLLEEAEFAEIGLVGPVSQDPVTLARQGRKVLLGFARRGQELKSPVWLRVAIETESLLEGLASDVEALEKVIAEISQQLRLVQGAAAEREEAFADFDKNYVQIGRSAEAAFRMAGMDAEADRARLPSRRLSRGEPDESAPEAGAPEEPVPEAGSNEPVPEAGSDEVTEADTTQ